MPEPSRWSPWIPPRASRQHRRMGARPSMPAGWAMVSWPRSSTGGRGANLMEWLIFRGRVLSRGARPCASTRTASFCSGRHHDGSTGHPSRGPATCQDGLERGGLGPGLVGAQRRQRHGRHPGHRHRDGDDLRDQRPEDLGLARRLRRLALRDVPHRSGLRASPGSHVRPRAARQPRVSPCVPIEQLDGETGFAEVFLDDVRVPRRANQLGELQQGLGRWRWPPRDSSVASCCAAPPASRRTAARLVALYRDRRCGVALRSSPALRDAWRAAGWTPRPTASTPTRPRRGCSTGGKIGAEASLNKIFWSELDVHMHETALEPPRRARSCCPRRAGSGRRRRRGLARRLPCSRCRVRSTRARTRSNATSSPSGMLGLPRKG